MLDSNFIHDFNYHKLSKYLSEYLLTYECQENWKSNNC